jgi:hypothetical protein
MCRLHELAYYACDLAYCVRDYGAPGSLSRKKVTASGKPVQRRHEAASRLDIPQQGPTHSPLTLVAALAGYIAARRASRIEPLTALRA